MTIFEVNMSVEIHLKNNQPIVLDVNSIIFILAKWNSFVKFGTCKLTIDV